MANKVIILGSGSSSGVPSLSSEPGGNWGDCDPANPRNRRTRPSIYIEYKGQKILVDTSTDLRQQYLDNGLTGLDAVILTHAHADHISGIDDLRKVFAAQGRQTIPVYATIETFKGVKGTYNYLFEQNPKMVIYPKVLDEHIVTDDFAINGCMVNIMHQPHGIILALGLRFGSFAYSTAFQDLPEQILEKLAGIELWIVDCLSIHKNPLTHSHLEKTLEYIERIKPKKAVLTHMGGGIDYEAVKKHLPPHVEPGYDGMVLQFD